MIHVLVLEEVRAIGEMITLTLHSETDIEVIGCSGSLEELRTHLHWCDVVLINSVDERCDGPSVIRAVRETAPRAKIIVVGVKRHREAMREWIEAGASGYLYKDESLRELLRMIRSAHASESRAATLPKSNGSLLTYPAEMPALDEVTTQPLLNTLTRREREVLRLVQQDLTNQEIAETLVIELGTVKNHVHNILRKLNINSRRDTFQLCRPAPYRVWADGPVIGSAAPTNGNRRAPLPNGVATVYAAP